MSDFTSGTASKRLLASCIALWLAVAGVSIFLHGAMPLYSTRTLSVGWEMWLHGSWLVPLQNGVQYSHKAPLLYWLYHAGWAVAGVNDTWPRVLALIFGALALMLVYRLARALFPQRPDAAILAPWIVAGSTFFLLFALQLMFDVLLGLCVLAAFLALVRGDIYRGVPSWVGFALALGLGMLVKGPVMLLHVVFPVLLAPLWSEEARAAPARWYGRAALAIVGGLALFACWLVPALLQGDAAYREALLFKQTTGRIVQSFDHARAWWWYLAILPALAFPWALWPGGWRALAGARRDDIAGTKFLACWLLPTLLAFSLVSGKQAYYLVPELGGLAVALAAAIAARADSRWPRWYGWPPALVIIALGALTLALPWLPPRWITSPWVADLVADSRWIAWLIVAAGAALLVGARRPMRFVLQLGAASLIAGAAAHALFMHAFWPRYDLEPAALVLAQAQREGRPVLNIGTYEGEYQFLGRLERPLAELHRPDDIAAWLRAHPDGVVVQTGLRSPRRDGAPLHRQRFRSRWLEIWPAPAYRGVPDQ